VPASVCRGRAKPRLRVSRRSRRRLATALRPGTASLYINRGRYVHAILCPRPCVAALSPGRAARGEARRVSRQSRARRCRVSACRGEAALRLIDPRKLYSILRPGSINRLIVNNPKTNPNPRRDARPKSKQILAKRIRRYPSGVVGYPNPNLKSKNRKINFFRNSITIYILVVVVDIFL